MSEPCRYIADLTGHRVNHFIVLEDNRRNPRKGRRSFCLCDCGQKFYVVSIHPDWKQTPKSCGCVRRAMMRRNVAIMANVQRRRDELDRLVEREKKKAIRRHIPA